jgi:outer membrane protein TolC
VATSAPDVAPVTQPADVEPLALDASQIRPLYREILAIDLESTLRAAAADNLEIRAARFRVEQARGRLESAVGGAFPAIVPTAVFEHVEGTVRAVQGNLVGVGFNTFMPSVAVQWVTNPGSVIYEIIAAKKRLIATRHQEQSVLQESLRRSAVQYYELVLTQHRVSTANEAVQEAQELLRINRLRTRTGTGVPADEMRAEARVAERRQDLISAIDSFYQASIELAVTLHLDAAVTLIPAPRQLPALTLVETDLQLDQLMELAVVHRPDLRNVRLLVEAAAAAHGATWWGSFGPQFQLSYQYGGIMGHANNVIPGQGIPNNLIVNPASANGSFSSNPLGNGLIREGISRLSAARAPAGDQSTGMHDQQRMGATAGWRFSLSAIGDLRTAGAVEEEAALEAMRLLDQVKAQVVLSNQASRTNRELMVLSQRQMMAADETLRLSQANLQAGTMTTLDVLQAQDAANQARLRHAESVVRYNQSQINLLAALGAVQPPGSPPATAPIN